MKLDFLFTPYQKIVITGLKILKLSKEKLPSNGYKVSITQDDLVLEMFCTVKLL